ncbi:MAG: hypothetical protein ABSF60_13235, partial [Verrucomicrobiota bacterium]
MFARLQTRTRSIRQFVRISTRILALTLGAGLAAAQTNFPAGPAPAPGFTNPQLIETWGWIAAHQEEVAGITINRSELDSWLKGFSAGVHGQASPCNLATAAP